MPAAWTAAAKSGSSSCPAARGSPPEAAGIVSHGEERRVPGLRREEVAVLAGVSVAYAHSHAEHLRHAQGARLRQPARFEADQPTQGASVS